MKRPHLPRKRAFLHAAAAACMSLLGGAAAAQTFPSRLISIIVPYNPGGSTDTIARFLGQGLAKRLNTEVVVENKPGGNTVIATQYVTSAKPDGYTLYVTNTAPYSMLPAMYKRLPWNGEKDVTPIALIADIQLGMFTGRDKKLPDLATFVNEARAHPGKLVYGSTGAGQIPTIVFEMLKAQLKLDVLPVQFSGSPPMIQSLLVGDSYAAVNDLGTMMPHVKSGALVPVAVVGDKRLAALPNVPTFGETGLPIEIPPVWVGVTGPAGIPANVVTILNRAINDVMQSPEGIALLDARFHTPRSGSPADFEAAIRNDYKIWTPAVRRLGITLD